MVPAGGAGRRLEAAEALGDIGIEARLGELAVARNVDADLGLLAHDIGDALLQSRLECPLRRLAARDLGEDRFENVVRADQAADMGREDTIGASLHAMIFLCSWRSVDIRRRKCGLF